MSTLLLKNVVLNGATTNVLIRGTVFESVDTDPQAPSDQVIDGRGRLAILPPFVNGHTHAAMTVLRGFAEDLELDVWLRDHIWPAEATLSQRDVYAGSRLAILEMIRSGTLFFNDMYWHGAATARAAAEMGVRATIGLIYFTGPDGRLQQACIDQNAELQDFAPALPARVTVAHAPHAPYTVSPDVLAEIAAAAAVDGRMVHTHAAETESETRDCLTATGLTPVGLLDSVGLLGDRTVLAHCIHTTPEDVQLIAHSDSVIAHMPVSNLKLCSGFFDLEGASRAGCRVVLGTDGTASNNNLSMLEEMKFAALLAKSRAGSPLAGRDDRILTMATTSGAQAFGLGNGQIVPGAVADAILVDLDHPTMVGDFSLIANLVYSADTSVIDTVICDGAVLMTDRHVAGQDEIIAEARDVCDRLKTLS